MFIENPNKKETYSFRVKPELLENIKNYAKATNQTVPEILNDMIEDKTKGLYLTNDYLENPIATVSIISLPPLEDIYNKGNYREFSLFTEKGNRALYEIQQVPNNLDIWDDKKGYTSNKRGVDHEGISFVLAPELITKPEYLKNPELLFCCLVPVYFSISIKKETISVKNISFTEALEKIKNSPNLELMDEFTQSTNLVKDIILTYSNQLNNARENPDGTYYAGGFTYSDKKQLLLDLFSKLVIELNEATIEININVINHYEQAKERNTTKQISWDNQPINIVNLMEENELLKEKIEDLESKLNHIIINLDNGEGKKLSDLEPK